MEAAEQPKRVHRGATQERRHGAAEAPAAVEPLPEGDEGLETELLAALASRDLGEPTEEFDLASLTPAEREAVMRLLRQRLGAVGGQG